MPSRKRLARKTPRPATLKPDLFHLLKTGEEIDWFAFDLSYGDNARELFERVRGDYPRGTFPWAEQRFGREG
jgi:hypothetical protein